MAQPNYLSSSKALNTSETQSSSVYLLFRLLELSCSRGQSEYTAVQAVPGNCAALRALRRRSEQNGLQGQGVCQNSVSSSERSYSTTGTLCYFLATFQGLFVFFTLNRPPPRSSLRLLPSVISILLSLGLTLAF